MVLEKRAVEKRKLLVGSTHWTIDLSRLQTELAR
jgi:hypothetical protein